MKFVHPEVLWALTALTIPIIVHLFNFRKFRKVLFPNVAFLREVKQETQSKSKIKHLLILLSRLLAMACIVLAFAQPFIPRSAGAARAGERYVSIYIDNSFSTENESDAGPVFERLKNNAISIAESYGPSDRFQLLTNDFEGRHQRFVGQEEMLELIREVQISPVSKALSAVIARQHELFERSSSINRSAYILTDLQASVIDLDNIQNDTSVQVRIVPLLGQSRSNLFVDSLWFASPVHQLNQVEELNLRIRNVGDEPRENVPLQVIINNVQKAVAPVTCAAGQTTEIKVNFTNTEAGYMHGRVSVDDHPVVFDDSFYFAYRVSEKLLVQDIRGRDVNRDPVALLFADDPEFEFATASEGNIDFAQMARQNLVVLNQLNSISSGLASELSRFTEEGGSVLFIPASKGDVPSYNQWLQTMSIGTFEPDFIKSEDEDMKVSDVDYDHILYRDAIVKTVGNVELPRVKKWLRLNVPVKSNAEVLLRLRNSDPLLLAARKGSGRVYVLTSSLDAADNNLSGHALYTTSLIRMAEFSVPHIALNHVLGSGSLVKVRLRSTPGDAACKLRQVGGTTEFIPMFRVVGADLEIQAGDALQQAGNYEVIWGNEVAGICAFNYNRAESDMKQAAPDAVQQWIEERGWRNFALVSSASEALGKTIKELDKGRMLWWTMLVWALIFLAIEILLIKYWR